MNPDTPVLVNNCGDCPPFGEAMKTLPDIQMVVIGTLENYLPGLGLGYMVLGYEGSLW